MTDTHPAPSGTAGSGEVSDLRRLRSWWGSLGGDGFVVLPPPTRERYTQTDGHDEAAALLAGRGLPPDTSFAYWHWQAHRAAFDGSGALTGRLLLHWGGDHATVAAGLGSGPPGYRVVALGPRGAFSLDRVTHRDARGLPDPEDPVGVRQFLAELDGQEATGGQGDGHGPLTPAQSDWLHARLRDPVRLPDVAAFVTALEHRNELTYEETARLVSGWREEYEGQLTAWEGWPALLHAMLRHGHDRLEDVVTAIGSAAAPVLGRVPSERGLATVRRLALDGDRAAVEPWLRAHASTRGTDWVRAANTLAAELTGHRLPEEFLRSLYMALQRAVVEEWRTTSGSDYATSRTFAALTPVRFATDERLSQSLRVAAGHRAYDVEPHVREQAAHLGPAYEERTGISATEALAAADRYAAVRGELLRGSGPDLTDHEKALCGLWHRYRTLSRADVGWLRSRVADPRTGLQGLGFCLELLLAHGEATEAEVEALLPRWRKQLAKNYRTTYVEWRHPLVTLTCIAQDVGHPAAGKLVQWWAGTGLAWAGKLRLLTHLGAPDEAKAAELWEFVTSGAHDEGHLMTWVLMRARLDGTRPVRVADGLLTDTAAAVRDRVAERVLLAVADPEQPLWHYSVDRNSRSWWQRAQEVADDPELSSRARAVGLKAARAHRVIASPERVRPEPTASEVAAARDWVEQRVGHSG